MRLTIHRGAHEIGGNCAELATDKTRIILDLGMPLVEPKDKQKRFDTARVLGRTAKELLAAGILPNVPGLYEGIGTTESPDALLLSHPHQDHYALCGYLRKEIPIYLSQGAKTVIEVSDIFLPIQANLGRCVLLSGRRAVAIGDCRITPYLMDHSGFGAMAFLIEAEGKRVFYSGDFRGHGRKWKVFEEFLHIAPKPVDVLLMEGTTVGAARDGYKSEEACKKALTAIMDGPHTLVLAMFSPQNVDRLVSFYKAAKQTGRTLVIDPYAAYLLTQLGGELPQPEWAAVKVFYPTGMVKRLMLKRQDILKTYRNREVKIPWIEKNRTVFLFRESMIPDIKDATGLRGATLIYSQWTGYRNNPGFAGMNRFLHKNDIQMVDVHTSGHAPIPDLKRFIHALQPTMLVPIHTFSPDRFKELHGNVRVLFDGKILTIN